MESTTKTNAFTKQVGGNHYKDLAIQPMEYCQKNKLGFAESCAIKYLTRYKNKNGKQDLLKAIHNIELLIEMEYQEDICKDSRNVEIKDDKRELLVVFDDKIKNVKVYVKSIADLTFLIKRYKELNCRAMYISDKSDSTCIYERRVQ